MFERFYKENSNFVYVKLSSDIDDKQLASHISSYNIEAKERTGLLELCDCRKITSLEKLTVEGCVEMGMRDTGQNRFLGGKLAFLVSDELQFGLARAFEAFASESGREIEIFYDFMKAIEFLNSKNSIAEIVEFIEGIETT